LQFLSKVYNVFSHAALDLERNDIVIKAPGTQLFAGFDCSSKLLLYLSQLAFFFGLGNSLLHLLRVELCSQKQFLIVRLDL